MLLCFGNELSCYYRQYFAGFRLCYVEFMDLFFDPYLHFAACSQPQDYKK